MKSCLFFFIGMVTPQLYITAFEKASRSVPMTLLDLENRVQVLYKENILTATDVLCARAYRHKIIESFNAMLFNKKISENDLLINIIYTIKKPSSVELKQSDTQRAKKAAQAKPEEVKRFKEMDWGPAKLRPLKDGRWVELIVKNR